MKKGNGEEGQSVGIKMKGNIKVNKNQIFWFGRAWTPFGLTERKRKRRGRLKDGKKT